MRSRRGKTWDRRAQRYDEWRETFDGAVGTYVDLELLKKHLPENRDAKILDAAEGTSARHQNVDYYQKSGSSSSIFARASR